MKISYEMIVFMQDDAETMEIMEKDGITGVLSHLKQWDNDDGVIETRKDYPWGGSDTVVYSGNYVLSYNTRLGYFALIKNMTVS